MSRNAEPKGSGDDAPHYLGHRERMKERFQKVGHQGFAYYEMLEMILYRSIRRGDTKPLAKALLAASARWRKCWVPRNICFGR